MTSTIKEDLNHLLKLEEETVVSVYLPTHRAGAEIQQDPIRLKNLLRKAESALESKGWRRADIEQMLKPALTLVDERVFWQNQRDGLAMFFSKNDYRQILAPRTFRERVVLSNRPYIKPLLPLLDEGKFFILSLAQHGVRLFEADRFSIQEIELKGIPKDLGEATKYDSRQQHLQFHVEGRVGQTQTAALFHGHGDVEDDVKDQIHRFFLVVNKGVFDEMKGRHEPLIVAGVEYLHPIYAKVNSYHHLVPKGVYGNPEFMSPEELHREALKCADSYLNKPKGEAVHRFNLGKSQGLASSDVREIVPAAVTGRVDTLFLAHSAKLPGRYVPETNSVEFLQEKNGEIDVEDLLDFTGRETLNNSGFVFSLPQDEMPDKSLIAAVFRY